MTAAASRAPGPAGAPDAHGPATDARAASAAAGRDARLARLLAARRPALVATARRLLGDAGAAEDVVQDACLELLERLDGFDDARAAAWLHLATTHRALDLLRRRRAAALPAASAAADAAGFPADERERVSRALAALPARQREIVERRFLRGDGYAEIAASLGLAAATVKTHAARALETLRRRLGGPDHERNPR